MIILKCTMVVNKKRKHGMMAFVGVFAVLQLLQQDQASLLLLSAAAVRRPARSYSPRRQRTLRDFNLHSEGLNDEEFRIFYRVTRTRFVWLTNKLAHLAPSYERAGWLTVEMKLAITLRYLAGGSYLDIREMWGIRTAAVFNTIHIVIPLIANLNDDEFPDLPTILGMEEHNKDRHLRRISDGFSSKAKGLFRGCVGCIDGLCVRIIRPSTHPISGVANPAKYFNRKGFYALAMQGVCDSDRRIIFASVLAAGSVHASMAWNCSSLAGKVHYLLSASSECELRRANQRRASAAPSVFLEW
jgi:hypothetical protein